MLNIRGKSSQTINRKQMVSQLKMAQVFPLRNKKIRLQNWEDDYVTIKQFRSRCQLAKKKCESIPLLRNSSLNAEIMRSHNQQYNIYIRKHSNITDLTSNIKIVNGHAPQNKQSVESNKLKNRLNSATINVLNWQSTILKQTQPIIDKRLLLSSEGQILDSLRIQGKQKKLSPQRNGRRSISSFDYRQLKF